MADVNDLRYRTAIPEDVREIAALFRHCNPGSIWTQLGDEVSETYSRHYIAGPSGLTVVAVQNSRVVGACMGTTDPVHERCEFYKQNGRRLVSLVGARAFRDPGAALAIVRRGVRAGTNAGAQLVWRLRRRAGDDPRDGDNAAATPSTDTSKTCYVAVLCVDASTRGRGAATAMLQEFLRQGALRGCRSCRIGTTESNLAAQRAIEKAGFRPAGHSRAARTYVREVDAT